MILSDEDRAVLADVVIDPEGWVEHVLTIPNGELAVWAKVLKYRPDYLARKDLPGYLNRAERDAEEEAIRLARVEELANLPNLNTLLIKLIERVEALESK